MTEENRLDWYIVRMALVDQKRVALTFLFAIFVLALGLVLYYVLLLMLTSQVGESIVGSVLFLVVQILLGLFATRSAFQFGSRIRQLQVPPQVTETPHQPLFSECDITEGDIPKIFEQFQIGYDCDDPQRVDDFTDLGWFFVTVFAILSMMIMLLFGSSVVLIYSVVIVQGVIVFFLLVLGYKYTVSASLDDSFVHLEFVVSTLMTSLLNDLREFEPRLVARWVQQLRKSILYDIAMVVDYVDFGLRIGSDRPASVLVPASSAQLDCIRRAIPEEWTIHSHDNVLEIHIPRLALNLSEPSRSLLAPDTVNVLSAEISTVIQTLLSDPDCTKHAS
ncbi:MAG: hypothetical protein K9W43_04490 [Candidatus Thorarchaeota archaeon]|nr:hypothetical protein [Candidatus Thorarchaeota archaeon]